MILDRNEIEITLRIAGEDPKRIVLGLDEDTIRMCIIHWREREYARIAEAAGNPIAVIQLSDKIENRKKFIQHLGGMLAQRIMALFEYVEKK